MLIPMDYPTPFITLTGIDTRVDLTQLRALSRDGAELGYLYTFDPAGRNRYINRNWCGWTQMCPGHRASLHVCGKRAREQLFLKHKAPFDGLGDPYAPEITELGSLGGQANLLRHVQRIQVNGLITCDELERIAALYPWHTIITQHMSGNEDLLFSRAWNHAILVDGSGGTGKSPAEWVAPQTSKPVGFAGGLGPDNLAAELPRIKAVARKGWWIDMETKLRIDDWFSVDRALEVMRIFRDNT